jgi:hypothetical protein
MGWLATLPLALAIGGIGPMAVHAKASDISPAIAVENTKSEVSNLSTTPQQYVATRWHRNYRPYYYRVHSPYKFFTYRYVYNPFSRRYEYRYVYFYR